MKNLIMVLSFIGLTTTVFAQNPSNKFEVALDEVEVFNINSNYLNAIGHRNAAELVKFLVEKAASFDLEFSNCLKADYDKQDYSFGYGVTIGMME